MPEYEILDTPIRVGLLGDTHCSSRGSRALPRRLLMALEGCDAVFHTGDISARWVLDVLGRIAPVFAVRGNNEEIQLNIDLPSELLFRAGAYRIGLIHGHQGSGTGRETALQRMQGRVDCVVYGHSHRPEVERYDGLLMINPGSPTQRRRSPQHTCAIMDINETIEAEIVALD